MCIDWAALGRCSECMSENEVECKDVCRNIVTSPNGGALYSAVVFSYLMVLMAYLAYRAMVLAKDLKSWVNMQRFFNDDLGITDSELQAIEWAVVTQRIISLQVIIFRSIEQNRLLNLEMWCRTGFDRSSSRNFTTNMT